MSNATYGSGLTLFGLSRCDLPILRTGNRCPGGNLHRKQVSVSRSVGMLIEYTVMPHHSFVKTIGPHKKIVSVIFKKYLRLRAVLGKRIRARKLFGFEKIIDEDLRFSS